MHLPVSVGLSLILLLPVVVTQLKIGRSPDCDFAIPDPEISSAHATIHFSPAERCWKLVSWLMMTCYARYLPCSI